MKQPHILYLHGFNSSPLSYKAQALMQHMKQRGWRSQLTVADIPPRPTDAENYLLEIARTMHEEHMMRVVGSSLGGFYATWLAEQFGTPAVLINPAVRPHERLEEYLGENKNYHTGETWTFTQEDIETLKHMTLADITQPDRYRVLLQTGDETLDYRQAEQYYQGSDMHIEQGGDHAFQGFDYHIDGILKFCGF